MFCYMIFTDSHQFNETFLFSAVLYCVYFIITAALCELINGNGTECQSYCCNGTFADVLFTLLLAKNI